MYPISRYILNDLIIYQSGEISTILVTENGYHEVVEIHVIPPINTYFNKPSVKSLIKGHWQENVQFLPPRHFLHAQYFVPAIKMFVIKKQTASGAVLF